MISATFSLVCVALLFHPSLAEVYLLQSGSTGSEHAQFTSVSVYLLSFTSNSILKHSYRVKMIYTSETIQGQIYVPIVNWICKLGHESLTCKTTSYPLQYWWPPPSSSLVSRTRRLYPMPTGMFITESFLK